MRENTMHEGQYKNIVHRELAILENFLQEAQKNDVKESVFYIFNRLQYNIAKLKGTKEECLAPRFMALLNNIKPHLMELQKKKDHTRFITEDSFLDEKICTAKIIHFHINDKFANSTINLITKYFNNNDHLHIVRRILNDSEYTKQVFPSGSNVVELKHELADPKNLDGKKLIFHSLFARENVLLLYTCPSLLAHSYWMVWGGDLYSPPSTRADEFVRKNIYAIGTFSDAELVKLKYGDNHKFFTTNLTVAPLGKKEIHAAMRRRVSGNETDGIIIQINNSADESTLGMLGILSKFKDEKIRIKTVVSYGDMQFSQAIIEKGKKIFGEKFSYLEKMITPAEYAEYIAENNILILCQDRQQGVSNCCHNLLAGKKVFIRKNVTTSTWLRNMGIVVFDSDMIDAMDFSEFIMFFSAVAEKNRDIIEKKIYSEQMTAAEFKPVFDDECFDGMPATCTVRQSEITGSAK